MMKSTTMIGAVALAATACSSSAFAQDKDWSVTLGLKGWANVWETGQVNSLAPFGSNAQSYTSGTTWAAIPSAAVKYKDFFVSSSYFINTSYNFPLATILVPGVPGNVDVDDLVTQDISAKRKEFDINIGWYFAPQVAVTLGYKQVNQKYTNVYTFPATPSRDPLTTTNTTKNKAPTIGIVAGAPVGNSDFLMYLNASSSIGRTMKATFSESDDSWKGWYASGELGFGYRIVPGLTATAGYKYQIINLKVDTVSPTQKGRDTTNGPVLGVAYTF